MKLGTRFYNDLKSKMSKIPIVWPWGIFDLNKLRTRFFSWNISVFKVNECRKLYFLLLFITKYFMTSYLSNYDIFTAFVFILMNQSVNFTL